MTLLRQYFKSNLKFIGLQLMFIFIFLVVFFLYDIDSEPILYAGLLCLWISVFFISYDFLKFKKKYQELVMIKNQLSVELFLLPQSESFIESTYQEMIEMIYANQQTIKREYEQQQTEMMDYYSMWAHQVKTPLAAMRLLAQSQNSNHQAELLNQLLKTEQYVEMGLGYLRIEQISSDLKLEPYALDEIIKQSVRRFSRQFISQNITLEFTETNQRVLTDEKWLVFVMDQLLSNALKYTTRGSIKIYMESGEKQILVIEDTGIGIAPEDLPRIFEKGFTGYNGRMDKKATGIGLYLCQKILRKLGHQIHISSTVNAGTRVSIDLTSKPFRYE